MISLKKNKISKSKGGYIDFCVVVTFFKKALYWKENYTLFLFFIFNNITYNLIIADIAFICCQNCTDLFSVYPCELDNAKENDGILYQQTEI